ncbi:MAG: hypothetical protein ACK4GQ_02110, partial [Candidatus Hadarchaeales archaeon]
VVLLFQRYTLDLPRWSEIGAVTLAVLAVVSILLFWKLLPERSTPPPQFRKDGVMDVVASISIALCVFSALFLTFDPTMVGIHPVNQIAVRVIVTWSLVSALVMLVRRLSSRRPIPV